MIAANLAERHRKFGFTIKLTLLRYGASQCGPLNNALNPTLGLKNSFFKRREGYSPYLSRPDETAQKAQITYQTPSPWWWSRSPLQRRGFD
jgi:hypothetical protein